MACSPLSTCIFTKRLFIFFTTYLLFSLSSYGQERCGTVLYNQKLQNLNPAKESNAQFEQWLSKKITNRKQLQLFDSQGRIQTTTYHIPVVIHVIHNGESVGSGGNLSDAQIYSQIQVLNDDFQRMNADAVNTPAEFASVAGSMNIEFVLAKQDPQGLATSGIVRAQGNKTPWTINDNDELKSISYWPAEDYLNIWVCDLQDYLGYTQFPISTLPGLEGNYQNRLTDGVVIGNVFFGTSDAGNFNLTRRYDKGRTVTHEVGHFFGLRHIWGDIDNCGGTDYVDDTPNQDGNTNGCPSGTQPACTAGEHRMYQNFIDYTDDACMNLYTKDQVSRMSTVIENSPRRISLITSHGLFDPSSVANDLGIKQIVSPQTSECDPTITPSVEIENFGNNTITSAGIQLKINSTIVDTLNFSGILNPTESTTISFSPEVVAAGATTFVFTIVQVNGVTDGNSTNDSSSVRTVFTIPIGVPFSQHFSTLPANWTIQNPDQSKTWEIKTAPFDSVGNKAIYLNFYDYAGVSEQDILLSPSFDLSTASLAYLTFNVAYAKSTATRNDALKVFVLKDCGDNIPLGTEVYAKVGDSLSTAPATTVSFTPKNENDWRTEIIDLSSFIGNTQVRLAFVGFNGHGNNLYLDNITLATSSFSDLAIRKILNPSIITCPQPAPILIVENVGTTRITDFEVHYSINSGNAVAASAHGLDMNPGDELEVGLPALTLNNGKQHITFSIVKPNKNGVDVNPANNQKTITTLVNNAADRIPLRENFDDASFSNWAIIDTANDVRWKTISTPTYATSLYFNSATLNDEAWFISPSLDFSDVTEASVFFDLSYALNAAKDASEHLRVLGSVGCGNEFDKTLFDDYSLHLSTTSHATPTVSSDWKRRYVDLTSLAGQQDVRIAFVATHLITGQSNNLYIDNLEFFISNDSTPPIIAGSYAIYIKPNDPANFYITFNLPDKQTVSLEILDVMGRSVGQAVLDNVLNESYPITLDHNATGIYIVRVRTRQRYSATKVFVGK